MPLARGHAGWDEYWASSRLGSCVPENAEIARTIAALWIQCFASLPAGARILDVATGNGIVLAYAAEASRRAGRTFALTGTDLATIDPGRHVATLDPLLRAATFRGGVAAEKLPFSDGAFDCLCSQYGLEYADLGGALAEARRVLAPGGRLYWLAHHVASDVVVQNALQRAEVDFLLAPGGPHAAMRAWVDALPRADRLPAASTRLEESLAAAERWCREHPPARVVVQVCTEFVTVARRPAAYRVEDLRRMLDDGERRLRLHRLRIDDLAAAVLTPARLGLARAALETTGWQHLRVDEFRVGDPGSPIGLWIQASRSPV